MYWQLQYAMIQNGKIIDVKWKVLILVHSIKSNTAHTPVKSATI
jgi:hypothetical protein